MAAFRATVESRPHGGIAIRLPFDPAEEWGERESYHLTGTVNGHTVRGSLTEIAGAHYLRMGPAWCRDTAVATGVQVDVVLGLEGPQLPDDLSEALGAEPDARRFFESLATFYRKGYVRWIEDAKRPQTRAKRVAETVAALRAGRKER